MRNILFLSVVSICIAACNNDGYDIRGFYPGAPDGTQIYMTDIDDLSTNIDSAIVSNSKFTFKGKQDTPIVRMLISSRGLDGGPVVLQNGTIKVSFGNGMRRQGTPLNNDLQRFFDARNEMSYNINKLFQSLNSNDCPDKLTTDSLQNRISQIKSQFVNVLQDVIGKNMKNTLGSFLLTQSEDYFTSQELYSIMSLIPENLRGQRFIAMYERLGSGIAIAIRAKATEAGCKYINFELPDINEKKILFSDIVKTHKYTILDFWASWCIPCRQEIPVIKDIYNKYKKLGVAIVGLSLDSSLEEWKEGISSMKMDWTQLCEPGKGSSEVATAYGITSIPSLLLIDSQGIIVMRGEPAYKIAEKLEELLRTE